MKLGEASGITQKPVKPTADEATHRQSKGILPQPMGDPVVLGDG